MGDAVEMLEDSFWDGYDEEYTSQHPSCNHCGMRNLIWKQIKRKWILMDGLDTPHICDKYSPPLKILKYLAAEQMKKNKQEKWDKIIINCSRKGGLTKQLPFLNNGELLDLLEYYVRCDSGEPDVGMDFRYKNNIKKIKQEILNRIK